MATGVAAEASQGLGGLPAAPIGGKGWYVAPNGNAGGDGSRERPWDIETAFRHPPGVQPGDTLWLRGGTYGAGGATRYTTRLKGAAGRPIVVRQHAGERATVNAGIHGLGEWTWFWGFEITNSSPVRLANAKTRPPGLYLQGRGHCAINLVVNNTGHPAIGFWEEVGEGAAVYGCIIWGTGTYDTDRKDRRRGSAIYAQNKDGARYIQEVISFRNYSTGMKAYTEKACANGFHFEGNISFDNGDRLIFVSGRDHPAERVVLVDNYTYRTATENDPPVRLGYPDTDQVDAIVRGNYFVNGTHADGAFWAKRFTTLEVTGNVFVSPNMLATVIRPSGRSTYTWNNNRYYGGTPAPFRLDATTCSWDEWKARTHFDAASTRSAGRPPGAHVFVRANAYDPARAHVVVYNWDKTATIAVELGTFLRPGERFAILDVQNYWADPIVSGTFDGKRVTIPMNLKAVAEIRGESLVPNIHTSEEFGAFVVLKMP